MSWTDKQSIRVINYLRDKFKIKEFVETGTHKAINATLHSKNFEYVYTCDIVDNGIGFSSNVFFVQDESYRFLEFFDKKIPVIFYLDAHFYNKKLPKSKRFVVKDELKALKGHAKSIIIIHDFDNNLGHIVYDGISLDMKLLKPYLNKVNPKFHYYTNTLESCDIMKVKEATTHDMMDNLKYVWSRPVKTYRGILYCLPKALTEKEMKKLGLREWS